MPSMISSNLEQQITSLGPSPSSTKISSKLHLSQLKKGKTSMEKKRKQIEDSKILDGLRRTGRGITDSKDLCYNWKRKNQ